MALLGITAEQLREALRERRDQLPPRDPSQPNTFTQEFVDALGLALQAEGGEAEAKAPEAEGDAAEPVRSEADEAEAGGPLGNQVGDVQHKGDKAVIFSVTSGKGGVGKTSLAVNIATEFATRGYRTVLVDTDLGLANTHILSGVQPAKTLSDYLNSSAELAEIIVDGPGGVKLISGGSGVKDMANLDEKRRGRVLAAIRELQPFCDLVILDTGAGISNAVTDFVSISDHTVVVTTSNFAAIADAYGIIKVMVQADYSSEMHLLVNRVRSPEEAEQVFKKLKGCTERFLSFDLNWLGLLPEDNCVEGAVTKRTPFCESYPGSVATRYLKKVVTALERFLPSATAKSS